MKREQSDASHFLAAILDMLGSSDTSLPETIHTSFHILCNLHACDNSIHVFQVITYNDIIVAAIILMNK